jgi:polyribonucleotide nucleotidyltransferase
MTLSTDNVNPPDILAINAASAALCISNIPFNGPVGAVRVGKVDGNLIVNPTYEQIENSDLDLILAGTKNGLLMVEGEAQLLTEEDMLEALEFGHKEIIELVKIQEQLVKEIGNVEKIDPILFEIDETLEKDIRDKSTDELKRILTTIGDKQERVETLSAFTEKSVTESIEKYTDMEEAKVKAQVKDVIHTIESEIVRNMIINEKKRIDGRGLSDVRDISSEVGILPRTHGSAVFTRGQTQSLGVLTLGSVDDAQRLDDIEGEQKKGFMLHYNFPPFSVGETGRMGFTSRREIGHGMLAERALSAVLPHYDDFPYTIRLVSEILESNGSSSMATVCSGTLSMLDAGVPIKDSVAGVAMGLVMQDENNFSILTDILGEEDHLGDMDFKVAGTKEGITAFQMDIKVDSITFDIMKQALAQAKEGRLHILSKMEPTISTPREKLSDYAPKIEMIQLPKDKIALVIGPGGATIKDIIAKTETSININDEGEQGVATIAGVEPEKLQAAIDMIKNIIMEPEVGTTYEGEVRKIMDFGAFVSLPGKKDGLVHISAISEERVNKVEDVLKEGDIVKVKVQEIKRDGKISLSMKDADK